MPKPDAPPSTDLTAAPTARNASVDVLRGLVMCTMVFVNDVAPGSIRHFHVGKGEGVIVAIDASHNSASVTCR